MANYVRTDSSSEPTRDNAFDIGSELLRFNDIYAQTFQGTAVLADNITIVGNPGDVLVYNNESLKWTSSGAFATKSFVSQQIASINSDVQINLDGYVTDLELETAIQNALSVYQPNIDLSSYALKTQLFSGSYNDLVDVPDLVVSYDDLTDKPTLFSGNYDDLTNKPFIPAVPTNISVFTNDSGYALKTELFSGSYNDLVDVPQIEIDFSPYALKTELFSGSYNDLTDKPIIPTLIEYATKVYVDTAIADAISSGTVDLSNYYTKSEIDTSITNISLTPGPQGEKGEPGNDGARGADGNDGAPGKDGINGIDGIGVTGGFISNDILFISLTNGTTTSVGNVRGPQGEPGKDGINGIDGINGVDGIDGTSYTDDEVDLHLNTSTANTNEVLSWNGTDYEWVEQTSVGEPTFSGSYNDLTDKPNIPADISELTDTTGLLDGGEAYDQSLNTTDTVQFASVTTAELTVTGIGNTTITSGADVRLDSPNRVSVVNSPFRLAHMTNAERDAIIAVDGDMIYNTDDNNFQVYTQGSWFRLSLTPIV